jgi:hypothetical protein
LVFYKIYKTKKMSYEQWLEIALQYLNTPMPSIMDVKRPAFNKLKSTAILTSTYGWNVSKEITEALYEKQCAESRKQDQILANAVGLSIERWINDSRKNRNGGHPSSTFQGCDV